MTTTEYRIFSLIKTHPDKPGHLFQAKARDIDPVQVINIIERLEKRGLIRKTTEDWESYTANSWDDITFEEQIDQALAYITHKHTGPQNWSTNSTELSDSFNGELSVHDLNAICQYLIDYGMVRDCSTKDGVCVGSIDATHSAYKRKLYFKSDLSFNYTDQRMTNTVNNYGNIHGDINQTNNQIDIDQLAKELGRLRLAMKERASSPEHDIAVGAITAAEIAVKKKDVNSALSYLKKGGKWAFDTGVKIGTTLAVKYIEKSIGN